MDVSHCDAGTLYLLEDSALHFVRMVTRSQSVRQGGHDAPISLPPVPLEPQYVCSWVALHNQDINVPDVHTDTRFDFTGSLRYDAMTGYRTTSMLVAPLCNDKGELIGVAQLINAMDDGGAVVPFAPEIELLVSAIVSQAAISLTNMKYAEQISALLDSLVGVLSTAIDERSHYNANHTRNMAAFAEHFLDWMDATDNAWKFSAEKRRAFLMSVWLHDVGKLSVPLEVMDKNSRLGPALEQIEARFRVMGLLDRIAALEGAISPAEQARRQAEREETLAFIRRVNKAGFLPDGDLELVRALAEKTYTDENGAVLPWLTDSEIRCLSIRRGTLTDEERQVMQSHAVVTEHILNQVQFPKMYSQVAGWAAAHHEFLNGKGYPHHAGSAEIPREVRLLTILDVFEALTARDRPYKAPMSVSKALSILHSMVEEGSVDREILGLFEKSRAWEQVLDADAQARDL